MICKQNKKASFDYYIDYNIIEKFYPPIFPRFSHFEGTQPFHRFRMRKKYVHPLYRSSTGLKNVDVYTV